MATAFKIVPKEYRDSVSLMQLSALLAKLPGVEQASAVMATPNNLALLEEAGFAVKATGASAADLLIVVRGAEAALAGALEQALQHLTRQPDSAAQTETALKPRSIEMALAEASTANIALISTPGEYAAAEAMKALRLGLNVMLFSDNVSEEDEIRLKRFARDRDLMVMGPDCGTAIINGVPLAFANVVKRGAIGAVGASGTGLQQVTVLVDRLGLGVSQAIGTGGRDLHKEIGGIAMSKGLRDLAADAATKVIVLISKPPAAEIAERILGEARKAGKPVVVNFLGADPARISGGNVHGARTLEDAARAAVAIARGEVPRQSYGDAPPPAAAPPPFAPGQRYIRGLFSGGTFCYEAALLLDERLPDVYSNTPARPQGALADVWRSHHHTLIDLGDDVFTRGRPHPMIDYRLRNERIAKEADDPQTAVILLDVVLGYGSNANPAGELVPALRRARQIAGRQGRSVAFVGHVCGTDGDPQNLNAQTNALTQAGMVLTPSNAQAVRLAAGMVAGGRS
ncbi:MAG TPA: acyl-CoA synthetase FdrA [Burkholderiales bacterium]|nr:acyl-CoA synthetase FdrA [Burkholderiales bacterium]